MCCSGLRNLMAQSILASITNDEETSKKLAEAFVAAGLVTDAPPEPAVVAHEATVPHDHARHAKRAPRTESAPGILPA